jgi:2-phosphosulfolactate phosphatase
MNIKIIHDAKESVGIAVIIDVFRAFTVEPYIIQNGAKKLIPVGEKQEAYKLKEENNEIILIGEREGIKLPEFDYRNSPSQIENIDFTGKIVIHTTSCGTQGIVRAEKAEEIITGSFVNAQAIVQYVKSRNINDISIVSLARIGEKPAEEDELCAKYIKGMLEDKPINNLSEEIEKLKLTSGLRFFNKSLQSHFPKRDFYLCTEINKFNFVLKVIKEGNKIEYMEKIDM